MKPMPEMIETKVSTQRFPLLDFLRWMAAIMVATYHWTLEIGPVRSAEITTLPIIGELVARGNLGVPIFFIISGFIIIESAKKLGARDFIFARFIRLFPALLISMILVLIVGSYFIRQYSNPFISFINSIFLTYTLTNTEPLATQLWTLLVEIQFYGIITLLLFLFPKIFRSRSKILILLVVWQTLLFLLPLIPKIDLLFFTSILDLRGFGPLFGIGICLNLLSTIDTKAIQFWDLFAYLSIFLYFIAEVFDNFKSWDIGDLILAVTILIILFSRFISINNKKFLNFISWLGLSSYPTYLLHEHLGMAFVNIFHENLSQNMLLNFFVVIFAITFFSIFLSIYIETPIQKLCRVFLKKLRVL